MLAAMEHVTTSCMRNRIAEGDAMIHLRTIAITSILATLTGAATIAFTRHLDVLLGTRLASGWPFIALVWFNLPRTVAARWVSACRVLQPGVTELSPSKLTLLLVAETLGGISILVVGVALSAPLPVATRIAVLVVAAPLVIGAAAWLAWRAAS